MSWKVPLLWPNSTIYIIGAGPSLIGMDLCLSPRDGMYGLEAYLWDKHVIGVNDGFTVGNYCDIWFWGDSITYWRLRDKIDACNKLKITCNRGVKWGKGWEPANEKEHDVKVLKIHQSKGLSTDSSGVGWNRSSGAAAINLAYHLGAKRVVLVGFNMDDSRHKKFKPGLKEQHKPYAYEGMRKFLPIVARDAKKLGLEILNATPDSLIADFKKVCLQEIA